MLPLIGTSLLPICIQEPLRLALDAIRPCGKLVIRGCPELAVIVCMLGSVGMEVEPPPLTGYSVTTGSGVASVMTLSEPYQESPVKVAVSGEDVGSVSSTVDSMIC